MNELKLKEESQIDEPPDSGQWGDWKWQLRNSFRTLESLLKSIPRMAGEKEQLKSVESQYPVTVTPYYLSLVDKDDPECPIAAQCLPRREETEIYFDMQSDPLAEEKDAVCPGLIHRYNDRVLITVTNICPVYCRHCTRKREWAKGRWVRSKGEMEDIYRYLARNSNVRDVIISGGDPLVLATPRIEEMLGRIRGMGHVELIRIGSRCPVVLPQRIDPELVSVLREYRPIWFNTHFNHPNEITPESSRACELLVSGGIPVNNQSVLLKGVNDDYRIMIKLCQELLKIGVRPYYLFQCDPVNGAGHLRTSVDTGIKIVREMRGRTSGLAIPNFVVDGLDGQGKVPLCPDFIKKRENGYLYLEGYEGKVFRYYNPEG